MTQSTPRAVSVEPEPIAEVVSLGAGEKIELLIYTEWKDLAPLRDEWDALLARSVTNEIFLTFDFLSTWSACASRRHKLCVVTAWVAGRLEGIAPLMLAERVICSVRLKTLEFLGTPFIDYADFIYAEPRVLEVLWNAVRRLGEDCDALYLREVKDDSPTYTFLTTQARLECKRGEQCLMVGTTPTPGAPPASYLQKPKFARHLNRHTRQLNDLGKITLDYYTEPDAIAAQVGALVQQHKERWNATSTPSCFNNPAMEQLYRRLSETLARSKRCLFIVMRLDGVPLCCHWGFLHNTHYLLHTTSRAVQYEHYYTGVVMLASVVTNLRQLNPALESIDLCRGEEHYKSYFGALRCTNYSFLELRSLRSRILMPVFFRGLELTRRYAWCNRAARKIHRLLYRE